MSFLMGRSVLETGCGESGLFGSSGLMRHSFIVVHMRTVEKKKNE